MSTHLTQRRPPGERAILRARFSHASNGATRVRRAAMEASTALDAQTRVPIAFRSRRDYYFGAFSTLIEIASVYAMSTVSPTFTPLSLSADATLTV